MDEAERLKQCYSVVNEFIREEHKDALGYSQSLSATLSISAAILACKLFDSDRENSSVSKSEGNKPSRADLLDL